MQSLSDIQNLLNEYDMLAAVVEDSEDSNVRMLVEMANADVQRIVDELNEQHAPLFEALQSITDHVRTQVVKTIRES